MSASAPKSTTDTAPELQLTEEERELLKHPHRARV